MPKSISRLIFTYDHRYEQYDFVVGNVVISTKVGAIGKEFRAKYARCEENSFHMKNSVSFTCHTGTSCSNLAPLNDYIIRFCDSIVSPLNVEFEIGHRQDPVTTTTKEKLPKKGMPC